MRGFMCGLLAAAMSYLACSASAAEITASPRLEGQPLTLGYTAFFVEHVAETVAFYGSAFGIPLKYMHPSKGYAELATGSTTLAFISEAFIDEQHLLADTKLRINRAAAAPVAAQLAFVSRDLEHDWSRAVDAGAKILKAPEAKPWGQTVGYLLDLNGVIVELCTPPTRQ